MVGHLAGLAEGRLVLSFAPSTPYFLLLKRIGEFFPKGAKASCPPCLPFPAPHDASTSSASGRWISVTHSFIH